MRAANNYSFPTKDRIFGPSSGHPGIVQFGRGNSSSFSLADSVEPDVLIALTTRTGGETTAPPVSGAAFVAAAVVNLTRRGGFSLRGDFVPLTYVLSPLMSLPLEISCHDAAQLVAAGAARLIDCRTPEEYATAALAGATLLPMHELPERLGELGGLPERGSSSTATTACAASASPPGSASKDSRRPSQWPAVSTPGRRRSTRRCRNIERGEVGEQRSDGETSLATRSLSICRSPRAVSSSKWRVPCPRRSSAVGMYGRVILMPTPADGREHGAPR